MSKIHHISLPRAHDAKVTSFHFTLNKEFLGVCRNLAFAKARTKFTSN
ncbi:hypothetical protein [Nonlabens dokdonensis]|nr:hypothetical protein [Nonlabens dokdonensis]